VAKAGKLMRNHGILCFFLVFPWNFKTEKPSMRRCWDIRSWLGGKRRRMPKRSSSFFVLTWEVALSCTCMALWKYKKSWNKTHWPLQDRKRLQV
jgi:hypothetical protein